MKSILAVAALTLFANSARADEVLKWAWEDANNDGVWNYSVVNWNFQSANEWNNFAVSRDAYQGATSLYFNYLNKDLDQNGSHTQAFAFSIIPTSYAGNGTEPNSQDEYFSGKDLSSYTTLEFFIKGSPAANQSDLNIWLRSPNGFGSVQVPLKKYVTVTQNWQKVSIPVSAFQFAQPNPNGFQLNQVHGVGFYVNQNRANVPFDFKVDNLSFVKATTPPPATRLWWSEDANQNNEYNYSTTSAVGGAAINVANQWGDAAISNYMTGPFGNSPILSVDLHFITNGSAQAYAEANLTTSRSNNGHEPTDFADRDAGKAIAPDAVLKFTSPGTSRGVLVKLVDANNHSSKSVYINDYRGSYGRYTFDFAIPVSALVVPGFDLNAVKSVTYFVDRSTPAGDYPLHLTVVKFDRP